MRSSALAKKVAELALTKKATDVVIMDLRKLTTMADFFVVCSVDSDIQARAVADAVQDGLGKKSMAPWHVERGSVHWVLLDYVDVVLHVFHQATRSFYNLEKLWGDAKFTRLTEDGTVARSVKASQTRRVSPSRRTVAS